MVSDPPPNPPQMYIFILIIYYFIFNVLLLKIKNKIINYNYLVDGGGCGGFLNFINKIK